MITSTITWPVIVLSFVLALTKPTRGQTSTNATCMSSFTWAENSLQQSPCLVTALLESLCDSNGVQVPALPPSMHYTGPTFAQATTCICSTVTYMLISACGACQDSEWIPWQEWSENCPTITLSLFPVQIPTTIDVPVWAYMNISEINGNFSVEAAFNETRATSATIPTSLQSSTTTSTSVPPLASSSSTGTNVGAIVGGVVGGLMILVAAFLTALWFCCKRRPESKNQRYEAILPEPKSNTSYQNTSMSTIPTPYTYHSLERSLSPAETRIMSPMSNVTPTIYTTLGGKYSLETVPHTFSPGIYHEGPEL